MRSFLLLAAAAPAFALNIPAFLAGLGPAPNDDPRFKTSTPPGPDDVRSPCPGLNTLANHGFINHNGKGLTLPILLTGLAEGLNMGADFTTLIGAVGLLSAPNPFGGSFDLNDLDQHNFPIEHDASLSRQDAYFGNDYSFYQPNFNMLLSHFTGPTTSIKTASLGKYSRVQNSEKINPQFTYGPREFLFSYGETALYLQTMSNPLSNGVANVDYIKMLFENETLPYDLGWRVSPIPITFATLGPQVVQLNAANPDQVPEDLHVLADSWQDAMEFEVGGREILANLTGGISKYAGFPLKKASLKNKRFH